ncbi:hypothetical protein DYH09_08310 [bacterium CPR1]|nr:hypothetical protein [bacterium CPR1]
MLTAIRPSQPGFQSQPARASVAPAQAQEASQPLDLTTIDNAQEAAAIPCLNPGLLSVVVTGAFISAMSNGPATAALQVALNGVPGSLSYTFNPQNPQQAITASGEVGGLPYRESWSIDQDKRQLTLTAQLGDTPVEVNMTAGEKSVLARGSVGDLTLTQVIGGEEDLSSVTSNGQLGNERFNHQIDFAEDENGEYKVSIAGQLGEATLEQTVTLARAEDAQLSMQGEGNLAGTSFAMSGKLYAGR